MKTNILTLAAIAFSVNAFAQNSCPMERVQQVPVYSEDKMESMYQNIGNNRVSYIDPSWEAGKDAVAHDHAVALLNANCYKMIDNYMVTVKGGTETDMLKYRKVKNGSVVLINGVVITAGGKVLRLKNGDSVTMQGVINRNPEPDPEDEVAKL